MEVLIIIFIIGFYIMAPASIQADTKNFDSIFKRWGAFNSIDWLLLKAIAMVESNLNPNALGDDGTSYGLMQVQMLIGQTYADVTTFYQLYDPETNVQVASCFLKRLIDRFGTSDAIQAYNLGETRFLRGYRNLDYLNKVLKAWGY